MELTKKLAEAQAEMSNPPLNGEAQISANRSYKYALLSDVEAVVKPPLAKRGIFLTQRIGEDNRLHTVAYFGDESMELDSRPLMCDGNPQDNGKAETYAKRYALCSVFCIVGEEDTDAQGVEGAPTAARKGEERDPVKESRNRAVVRLKEAIAAWCKQNGGDVEEIVAQVKARSDFMDSASFYNKVAYEYESEIRG